MVDLIEPPSGFFWNIAGKQWDSSVAADSERLYGSLEALDAFVATSWNHFTATPPDPVDMPSAISDHIEWLRNAGFRNIDVPWAYAGHAVIVGQRK